MAKRELSLNELVAERIRQVRLEQDISQEELGDLCGLHRTYIGSIERCERNITLSTLEKIAGSLDISPLELLKGGTDV